MNSRNTKFSDVIKNKRHELVREFNLLDFQEARSAYVNLVFNFRKEEQPTFEKIKKWYKQNLWSKEKVEFALTKEIINEEQLKEILEQEA